MTDDAPPPSPDADALEAAGIGSALIKARTQLGMTQVQLADESGLSRSAIKAYETGRNMPGSRELKALCRVLKITPNMLLFGSEAPFDDNAADHSPGMRLMLGDPEDAKRARVRLAYLSGLLTPDEVSSLLNLVTALALARHGAEIVEQHVLGADLMTGVGVSMDAAAKRASAGQQAPPGQAQRDIEESLQRAGHKPKKP